MLNLPICVITEYNCSCKYVILYIVVMYLMTARVIVRKSSSFYRQNKAVFVLGIFVVHVVNKKGLVTVSLSGKIDIPLLFLRHFIVG